MGEDIGVIDKGGVLSQWMVDEWGGDIRKWLEYWALYPDAYLDAIHDDEEDRNFKLLPYQRMFLRAMARYKTGSITATRGMSKSFSINLKGVFIKLILSAESIILDKILLILLIQ